MEGETDTLDWGQGEEEQQANLRRPSFDQSNRRDFGDADDIEDTVSLGEDEDEPIYYNQPQDARKSAYDAAAAVEGPERPPSSQRRSDDSGANGYRDARYRHSSREHEHLETSTSRDSHMSAESPSGHRRSANHSSPQRYQQNGTRLTHALPPKPALAQVPYLPPSHPSMVEAIGMAAAAVSISPPSRSAVRDSKKSNGAPAKPVSPVQGELPSGWHKRYSRSGGQVYYYHTETEETTWDFPVSKLPSTSTREGPQRHRRHSASSGHMNLTSSDSNNHHSQTSHPRQQQPHPRADSEIKDQEKFMASDPDGLSYEDRHYRPDGADPPSTALEIKVPERLDGPDIRPHVRPSPPRHRRRPRSISPQPDSRGPRGPANERDYSPPRGNGRSAHDRNVNTNPDPVSHREFDVIPPQSESSNRRWESFPPGPVSDFSRSERAPRRPLHRDDEDYMLESRSSDNRNRPPPRRNEDSRGPRDREPPLRPSDNRRDKPSESQNFLSAPRYRSPPRTHERDSPRGLGPPPPDVGPYSGPPPPMRRDRDRPSHFEHLGPNGPPLPVGPSARNSEPYAGRSRNYEAPSDFDHSRHREARVRDLESERPRRDPAPDGPNIRPPPPPRSYSGEPSRIPVDRAKRFPDDYNQVRPEEPPHRRRPPLPPQTQTFSTSTAPVRENDQFSYSSGRANGDPPPKYARYGNDANRTQQASEQKQDRAPNFHNPPQGSSVHNHYDRPNPSSYPPPAAYESKDYSGPSGSHRRDQSPPRYGSNNAPRQASSASAIPRGLDNRDSGRQGPGPGYPPQSGYNDRRDYDIQYDGRPQWKDNRVGNMYPDRNPPPPRRDIPNRPMDAPRRTSGGPVSGTNNVPIGTRRTGPQGYAPPQHPGPAPQPLPEAGKPTFNPDIRPPSPEIRRREPNGNLGIARDGEYDDVNSPDIIEEQRKTISKAKELARERASQNRLSVNERRVPQDHSFGGHVTPPPLSRDPSAMSVTSDHLSIRPSYRDDDNRRGRSGSYSQGTTSSAPNAPPRGESSQAHSSFEAPSSNEQLRPTQQEQRQHRERGPSRWGPEVNQSNEQTSEATVPPDSPPALARRMSSERPPRLRKIHEASANAGVDHDLRGRNSSFSANAPPPDHRMPSSNDFKDRLEVNKPTLLDRLQAPPVSGPEGDMNQPSLRERLVPSKRDHDDMDERRFHDSPYDIDDANDNKRARRRVPKGNRRGGGGGRRVIS